ncbi:bacteriocin immunity protein [Loigolactobacillus zhaoyuanensis]|uniref:bacteriocin immunity protein n=1 Tax=Loigolactobacillus zhaoyuanensis TaxID=2486017 RepID=UPI000F736743
MISQTYLNQEVKKDAVLIQLLSQQGKALLDGADVKLVCVKLNKDITAYLLAHQLSAPPVLMKLMEADGCD